MANGILAQRLRGILDRQPGERPWLDLLANNANALLGAAAGMDGRGGGWAGFAQGAAYDRQRREEEAERARVEAERQRQEQLQREAMEIYGSLIPQVYGTGGVVPTVGQPAAAPAPSDPGWMLAGSGATGTNTPPEIAYANRGAIRDQPISGQLANVLQAAASEAGIDRIVVASGGQDALGEGSDRTGSTRHDHGNAADVDLYVNGRLLDFTNPQDQAIYQQFVTAAARRGITGIGAGTDYMGNTRIHVGYGDPAVWGAGGSSANAPAWLSEAYAAGQQLGQGAAAPMEGGEAEMVRRLLSNELTAPLGIQMLMARATAGPRQRRTEFEGGLLVDLDTGEVLADLRQQEPGYGPPVTGEEARAQGLDPTRIWQQGPDRLWHDLTGRPLVNVEGNPPQVPLGYIPVRDANGNWTAQRVEGVPTAAQERVDTEFATNHFSPWIMGGGFADTQAQIVRLQRSLSTLTGGQNITGPFIGLAPDVLLTFVNPQAVQVRQQVEEVVQRSLRAVLGAQFTEREAIRLIERAYAPGLDETVNAQRVALLLDQLVAAAQVKADAVRYFQENGTLTGWTGYIPSVDDLIAVMDGATGAPQAPQPQPQTLAPGNYTWAPGQGFTPAP